MQSSDLFTARQHWTKKKISNLNSKKTVLFCNIVLADLKTKLKLFLSIPMPAVPTKLERLKELSKDNIICDYLDTYLANPDLIDSIPLEIFDMNKDFLLNVPIILNDLKEYLILRQEEVLDAQAGQLKSAALALQNIHTEFKTNFISKNWVKVSRKHIELPNMIEEFKPERIQKYFPLNKHNRLLLDMKEIEDSKLRLNRMSDYWKLRVQQTAEFLGELHKPLPQGKFGTRFIPPKIKKMVDENTYERIPYVKPTRTEI